MNTHPVATAAGLLLAMGCAGSHSAPTQQLADVQSANRSANELGAQNNPRAQLYLKLSEEQMKQAKTAMDDDDNESAARLLARAKMDAELAIALTREGDAMRKQAKATDVSSAQQSTSTGTGVTP
jgi:Domain of unknown function (DUF4398)